MTIKYIFSYIAAGLIIMLAWYICRKVIIRNFLRPVNVPHKIIYFFDALVLIGYGSLVYYRIFYSGFNNPLSIIVSCYYSFIGSLWVFILIGLIHLFYEKRAIKKKYDASRRAFFRRNLAMSGWGVLGTVAGIGTYQAFNPVTEKVSIKVPDKFKDLRGLTITQISDLHVGATIGKKFLNDVVEEVNRLNSDLIVITGDLVDGFPQSLDSELQPLKKLNAPLGIYYVTGNHEFYWGGGEWISYIPSLGIKVLNNQNEIIKFNNSSFCLAGVNDFVSSKFTKSYTFDPEKAVQNVSSDIYTILLSHRPRAHKYTQPLGVNLQLSGHTHGGQSFPWNLIVRVVQPYVAGLYNYKGMDIYVNKGTGFWGPPNRLGISGEITKLTLS